jgi:hypothetical protein
MSEKYLLLIVESEWDEATVTQAEFDSAMEGHAVFSAAVAAAGAAIVAGEALTSTSHAFSVRPAEGDNPAVYTDGPLVETTEALSGYYVIETETPQLARELAALCPTSGSIEVRPIWNMEM